MIFSGLLAQSSDVVPTPEQMDQLLSDSTIEQSQPAITQDIEPKNTVKNSKVKGLKNKKLRTNKVKSRTLKVRTKKLKTKKIKNKASKASKKAIMTGGEGSDE